MNITQENLDDLLALTKKASDAVMAIYTSNTTIVENKADGSPLTQADTVSHEILVQGLTHLFPTVAVLSEEGSPEENTDTLTHGTFWCIDPIDGTQEFVNRTGEFCIALGLIEDGKPRFGLVVAPTFDTVYFGGPGVGSFKKSGENTPQPIHVKDLGRKVVAVTRSHPNAAITQFIDEHFPDSERRPLGSMLKQMKLAEGEVDVYVSIDQPLSLWDTAAGNAIIEGAGGHMTKVDGSPLDYTNTSLKIGDFIARATVEI